MMCDFFDNYLKYKTKYLKLKQKMEGGAPPKESESSGSSGLDVSKALSRIEDEFMRRDEALQRQLSEVSNLINSLREQITLNRTEMLHEISKLRNHAKPVLDVSSVPLVSSLPSVSSLPLVSSVPLVPKLNVSSQISSNVSSQLNAILSDKSLEAPEQISRLDAVYGANQELCDTIDDKGLVTLLLRYACLKRDDALIAKLLPRLSMTRDYLLFMAYHVDKREENIRLFTEKINLDKFEQKNVEFIIEKGLLYLLPLLEGRFIKLDIKTELVAGSSIPGLRQLYIQNAQYYIDKICNFTMDVGTGKDKDKLFVIECTASQKKDRQKMQVILEANNDYDVIIDGGNLMHVGGGKSVQNIINAFIELTKLGRKPLVILYHKHTKDGALVAELVKKGVKYIGTPGANDDDIFTLLAFLNNSKKQKPCHILTNDRYKKWFAVYKHTLEGQEKQFEGFTTDALLEYRVESNGKVNILTTILPYSHCIQAIDSIVCIPSTTPDMFKVVSL